MAEHIKCLIIGSGPSGYTAAIYAARADLKPVVYQGSQPGGQLTETTEVDNFPGYPEGITGPKLMEDLEGQSKRFGTDVRYGWVTSVDLNANPKVIKVDEGTGEEKEVTADSVIISTGASAKWLGLENEDRLRKNAGGVSACAVCDGFFYRNQVVAVVGGGDTACEEATYLAKLCKKVYMLVRKDGMRASKAMQHRTENTENIEILYNTETIDVLGEEVVEAIQIKNNATNEESKLEVTGFFVAIGHKPNTDIFEGQLNMDQEGYLVAEKGTAKTNIEGVFVAGDAADKVYRQAITAAGTGCMAALDAERYLSDQGLN